MPFGEVVLESVGGGCPSESSVGSVGTAEVDESLVGVGCWSSEVQGLTQAILRGDTVEPFDLAVGLPVGAQA